MMFGLKLPDIMHLHGTQALAKLRKNRVWGSSITLAYVPCECLSAFVSAWVPVSLPEWTTRFGPKISRVGNLSHPKGSIQWDSSRNWQVIRCKQCIGSLGAECRRVSSGYTIYETWVLPRAGMVVMARAWALFYFKQKKFVCVVVVIIVFPVRINNPWDLSFL